MTIQTVPQSTRISPKSLALAFLGAGLAVAAGYGVGAVVLDEGAISSPSSQTPVQTGSQHTGHTWDPSRYPGFDDPQKFGNTNREDRVLMHRR